MRVLLYVEAPFASFAMPQTRTCITSYPVCPFSTIYGLLLSLVGEVDVTRHVGVGISLAMLSRPEKFWMLRKISKEKRTKSGMVYSCPKNVQQLSDVRIAIMLEDCEDKNALVARVSRALVDFDCPDLQRRFGILSLGESKNMVDSLRELRQSDFTDVAKAVWPSSKGVLSLPVWPNYKNPSAGKYVACELKMVSGPQEMAPPLVVKP